MKMIRVLTFILVALGCASVYSSAAQRQVLTAEEENKIVNQAGWAGAKAGLEAGAVTGLLSCASGFFAGMKSNGKALPHFWRAPWWDTTASLVTMGLVAGWHYLRNSKETSRVKRFSLTPTALSVIGAGQAWVESIVLDKSPRLNLTLCTGAALLLGQGIHSLVKKAKRFSLFPSIAPKKIAEFNGLSFQNNR